MSVLLETTLGDLVIDLYTKERPRTCLNFLKLCKTKYYNFTQFYSIEQNFIAQAGDPTNSGRGGSSVFEQVYGDQARYFEMEALPKIRHTKRGLVSMVNNGENLHGSQFFITLGDNLDYLDDKHTVFGEIVEGFDTLEKLNEVICDDDHRPYRDVWLNHTIILDDPYPDPKGLDVPERSPSPTEALLKYSRIGIDEEIDETAGKSVQQVHEEMAGKEAQARAHILTMIGDLHHAEERPPDNVLFVCKLNQVTTDDDLAIIFGRFGKILSCEVIRDKKTGNSLQYAFIEFERVEDCETAFFKMDNVLIDDRRIHVDFSQSVSKNFKWKGQPVLDNKAKKKDDGGGGEKSRRHHHNERDEREWRREEDTRRKRPASSRSRSPMPRRKEHRRRDESDSEEEARRRRRNDNEHRRTERKRRSPSPEHHSSLSKKNRGHRR